MNTQRAKFGLSCLAAAIASMAPAQVVFSAAGANPAAI
jgi:hypothetical protein